MPSSKVRPTAPTKPKHLKSSSSIPTKKALAIRSHPKSPAVRRGADKSDDPKPEDEEDSEKSRDGDNDDDSDKPEEFSVAELIPVAVPNEAPRKKKPKLHPQAAIKQAWKKFDPEYLGKVTKILPEAVPTAPNAKTKSTKSLNAAESYKQARTACEHAVKMIIAECIAANQKYTDAHFDIEADLKVERNRDCLDALSQDEDERYSPSDVKRLTDIFEDPKFFSDGAGYDDIMQGGLGDCWLMSSFSVLSARQELLEKVCVIQDQEVGVYGFVFHRDGEWHPTIIDDKLYMSSEAFDEGLNTMLSNWGKDQEKKYTELFQRGSRALYFGKCRDQNETWVPLLEKAFAKAHGGYDALSGGQTGEAIEDLTGGVTTEIYATNILSKDKFWTNELRKLGTDFMFDAGVALYREWQGWGNEGWVGDVRKEKRKGVVSSHAYAVLDTYEGFGERLVKVRNPWGQTEWTGAWSDGSSQWTGEWLERLNHKFGDDGVFWMSYKDFLSHFKSIERTRIFDDSWYTAQRWATMQVPFSTIEYQQTKFIIDVPEDTETVIVLSQLDDRYFHGLQGKYGYKLQFRVSMVDTEEEYLARSRPTYELLRSTNLELFLTKGRYTVLVKIEAEDWGRPTVEDVVKDNLPDRKGKLTTLARLYDLAHQKGQPEPEDEDIADTNTRDESTSTDEATQTPAEGSTESEPTKAPETREAPLPTPLPVYIVPTPAAETSDDEDEEEEKKPWNAHCVVGLRVYSKQPDLAVRVSWPPKPKPVEEIPAPALDRDDITKAAQVEAEKAAEDEDESSDDDSDSDSEDEESSEAEKEEDEEEEGKEEEKKPKKSGKPKSKAKDGDEKSDKPKDKKKKSKKAKKNDGTDKPEESKKKQKKKAEKEDEENDDEEEEEEED